MSESSAGKDNRQGQGTTRELHVATPLTTKRALEVSFLELCVLGVEDAELPPVSIDRPVREQQPATFTVPDHLLDLMGKKLAGFGSVAEVARALEELPSNLDGMFNKMRK